ncbi:MAG: DRTGG domain-containing protein [Bacteroidales bacterium]|jgi:serine kinase of HPr protein (carbohydrate metabolism regulator)|nr:DRTGG domain-containing protein [Bacteroidales bacterium]MDD3273368.1 DRTGG domain-containing protein [Bacteroidales bacterium]MDD4058236.1 DRTGG domain-containing protein [Bacteroidales bacterium]
MNVKDVVERLSLNVFSATEALDREVTGGYASDLLSDVMGHAQEGHIWITLQTHKNIMAVASLKDLAAIVLVKGFEPDKDTMELSVKEGIPVLGTKMQAFELAGKLYEMLK